MLLASAFVAQLGSVIDLQGYGFDSQPEKLIVIGFHASFSIVW